MLQTQSINDLNVVDQSQRFSREDKTSPSSYPNPQVKAKKEQAPRRSFSKAHKIRLLEGFDACETPAARGEFLRKEGLYYAAITGWRKALAAGELTGKGKSKGASNSSTIAQLTRENERLKKKLMQANAILELQKKVSEILGVNILQHESNEID